MGSGGAQPTVTDYPVDQNAGGAGPTTVYFPTNRAGVPTAAGGDNRYGEITTGLPSGGNGRFMTTDRPVNGPAFRNTRAPGEAPYTRPDGEAPYTRPDGLAPNVRPRGVAPNRLGASANRRQPDIVKINTVAPLRRTREFAETTRQPAPVQVQTTARPTAPPIVDLGNDVDTGDDFGNDDTTSTSSSSSSSSSTSTTPWPSTIGGDQS